jgi:Protein of unknown function (DUF3822)
MELTLQTASHTNPVEPSADLTLQVSEQGIRFPGEEIVPWKKANQAIKSRLDFFAMAQSVHQEVSIEVIHPAFLLLPNEYHDPLYRVAFLEKALGDNCMNEQELHEQSCPMVDSTLLFLIPSVWKDQLASLFPLAQIKYNHLIGNNTNNSKLYIHPRIHVYLQESKAYVTYFQHGQLQLANVFPFEHELALAYYLHSIRDSFDIQWNQESIRLEGPDSTNKQLIDDLIRLHIPLS